MGIFWTSIKENIYALSLSPFLKNRKNIRQGDGKRIFNSELIFHTSACHAAWNVREMASGRLKKKFCEDAALSNTIVDDDLFCSNLAYLGQNETKTSLASAPLLPNCVSTSQTFREHKKITSCERRWMQKSDCHGVMDDGSEHCMTLQVAHVGSESRLVSTVFEEPGCCWMSDQVDLSGRTDFCPSGLQFKQKKLQKWSFYFIKKVPRLLQLSAVKAL